uniref:Endonuclease/exonuclease/phosphatase domain-containing protein n=1 Tax=Cannabis sativa TaxID=3483 RepID=A0A803QQF5_CANSA
MEQSIDYEWLPVKCKNCTGFGHITVDCRKDTLKKKALNPKKQQPNLQQVAATKIGEVQMAASSKEPSQVHKSVDINIDKSWQTPKKTEQGKVIASCEYGFCATFVYGINTIDKRKSLWEDLLKLKMVVKPWVVLGDFNAIINIDDRVGGNSITFNDTHDASMWLATANVEVIPRAGSSFTWSNNQDGTSRIYSKIDHVFANEDWLDEFPNVEALFRWETIFDHCSCIVRSVISNKIGFKPFKYYNFWSSHPEFKETVLISWKNPITAKGLQAIYLKLMRLKHCLRKFIHNLIGDIGKKFQEAKSDFIEPRMQAQAHLKEARFLDK